MQISEQEQTQRQRTSGIASETVHAIGHGCGNVYWVAEQYKNRQDYLGVAFTLRESVGVKQEYAFISKDDFSRTDDELIADCAQQILGFPLYSKRDWQRRAAYMRDVVQRSEKELTVLQERLAGDRDYLVWLDEKAEKADE